ncbi:MAG: hypothetical protein JW726_07700 [Anaerolineales bacterium]|nr:hypothetical protein [Anaerolineales bacterium]
MAEHGIIVKYGCPECLPRKVETGETYETTVTEPDSGLKWRLLRLFGKTPPMRTVKKKLPIIEYIYDEKPIPIPAHGSQPFSLQCPHCGSQGTLQVGDGEHAELDWQVTSPERIKYYQLRDCPACGEKLSIYLRKASPDADYFGGCRNPKCGPGKTP